MQMTTTPAFVMLGVLLSGASCASVSTSADFNPTADFTAYRTYTWGPADAYPTGDPRLDSNPFVDQRIRSAIESELAAKGFRRRADGPADLEVHYHVSVHERMDVYTEDNRYGYRMGYAPNTEVRVYEQGTLVVDIAEVATKTVVWRGWAQTDISGLLDDRVALEERINEGVAKMFTEWPLVGGFPNRPGAP